MSNTHASADSSGSSSRAFLTPRLSSLWLALVTPLYVRVRRKLIDSIRHPTVVQDQSALTVFRVRPWDTARPSLPHSSRRIRVDDWSGPSTRDLRYVAAGHPDRCGYAAAQLR